MATTHNHVKLSVVNDDGNVNVLYPQNSATDVLITRSSTTPTDVVNVQTLVNNLGDMSFEDSANMVFLGYGEIGDVLRTDIDDNSISETTTWSSDKLKPIITELTDNVMGDREEYVFLGDYSNYNGAIYESDINDLLTTNDTTWSSLKIYNEINVTNLFSFEDIPYIKALLAHEYKYVTTIKMSMNVVTAIEIGFFTSSTASDIDPDDVLSVVVKAMPDIHDSKDLSVCSYQTAVITRGKSGKTTGHERVFLKTNSGQYSWSRWREIPLIYTI